MHHSSTASTTCTLYMIVLHVFGVQIPSQGLLKITLLTKLMLREKRKCNLQGTVLDRSNLTENAALNVFLKRSVLRSLSVPVTHSLLGYFCPVPYEKLSNI